MRVCIFVCSISTSHSRYFETPLTKRTITYTRVTEDIQTKKFHTFACMHTCVCVCSPFLRAHQGASKCECVPKKVCERFTQLHLRMNACCVCMCVCVCACPRTFFAWVLVPRLHVYLHTCACNACKHSTERMYTQANVRSRPVVLVPICPGPSNARMTS
jgi:hypothetical protein